MEIYTSLENAATKINNLQDWHNYCPPVRKTHWKDGRSAKELAKFWLDDKKQKQLEFLGFIQKKLPDFNCGKIVPEYGTAFDNYSNPRKNDLFILEKNSKTLITVEAKVDEPFGDIFIENLGKTIKEKKKNPRSRAFERMIGLYHNYFHDNSAILNIGYQLSYWFAGTIAEAERLEVDNAIMILHTFIPPSASTPPNAEKKAIIRKDFQNFFSIISEGKETINNGKLIGPIKNVNTNNVTLYIGWFES